MNKAFAIVIIQKKLAAPGRNADIPDLSSILADAPVIIFL